MSGQPLPKLVLSLVLVAASAALVGVGITSLTTDAKAPNGAASQPPVVVPAVPPAEVVPPIGTDAFTRPMFNRDRAQGPDKAPPPTSDTPDSSTAANTDNTPDDMSAMEVKGVIISDRGASAGLRAPGSGALTWVRIGDTINGWKVEAITVSSVRIRNGEDVAEINVSEDQ